MSKKLDELYETYAYNSRQKNQLRIADEKGLDLDKVKNPQYDWEQMREIIIAMDYGINPTPLCDPSIPSQSMENIRMHIFENEGIYKEANEKISIKRTRRIIVTAIFIVLLLIIIGVCIGNKEYIKSYLEEVPLELTDDHIKLEYGSAIHFMDYVKKYDKENDLVLPKKQLMNQLQDYTYIYKSSNGLKTVSKTLIVTVEDTTAPTLSLTQNNVSIEIDDTFSPDVYIKEVGDNFDNLNKDDLIIVNSVNNQKAGKYDVVYKLTDSSGNLTTQTLSVVVEEKIQQSNVPSTSYDNSSNEFNKSEKKDTVVTEKPSPKTFLISTYGYDITKCKNAAIAYMNESIANYSYDINGFIEPFIENGITKGYKVRFE